MNANRIFVVLACGLGLSACSSSSMPTLPSLPSMSNFDLGLGSLFEPRPVTLKVESDPPGADARSSTAASCRTPCGLTFKTAGDVTVEVSLNGYESQVLPVKVLAPDDPRLMSDGDARGLRLDPGSLFVALKPVQPPERKRSRRGR
ncbi:PEGA domain-containing protein [Xanthobacteraceae bacterium Astr-EGSB]|uniref:PEGA domain-containing protein n=1 Tax=Astrobacterium formosum TaxID=3069710 RepID=UPI0027B36C9E|nr:PEGA domain-containing protein [Xanthobacteraceae bacterium Astr-EGSB]